MDCALGRAAAHTRPFKFRSSTLAGARPPGAPTDDSTSQAEHEWEIVCLRSFAQYLFDWLVESSGEGSEVGA